MDYRKAASELSSKGRYGDTTLVHMNEQEVAGLASLIGAKELPRNPDTGLPEAFFLAPLGALAGMALGPTLGIGATLASAIGSGLGTMIETGDPLQALTSGALGYGLGSIVDAVGGDGISLFGGGGGEAAAAAAGGGGSISANAAQAMGGDYGIGGGAPISGAEAAGGGFLQEYGLPLGIGAGALALGSGAFDPKAPKRKKGKGAEEAFPDARSINAPGGYRHGINPEWAFFADGGEVEEDPFDPYSVGIGSSRADKIRARQFQHDNTLILGGGEASQAMQDAQRQQDTSSSGGTFTGRSGGGGTFGGRAPADSGAMNGLAAVAALKQLMDNTRSRRPASPGIAEQFRAFAQGGPVSALQEGIGGGNPIMANQGYAPMRSEATTDPKFVDNIINDAVAAIRGEHPNPDMAIQRFQKYFGPEAFEALVQRVSAGSVDGPGGGRDDAIPAVIDGQIPARLSDGEYVVPADVVSGLGRGSTDAGVAQLDRMRDMVRGAA